MANPSELSSLNDPNLSAEELQRRLQQILPDAPYYCYGNGSAAQAKSK